MSDAINHVMALEARIKLLETEAASKHAPSWQDVNALADQVKAAEGTITDLRIELARVKQISRAEVRLMIDEAGEATTARITKTLGDVFGDDKWRAEITEQAVERLRAEMKASIGAAAGSAQSAQAVAAANVQAALSIIKSASNYFAKG